MLSVSGKGFLKSQGLCLMIIGLIFLLCLVFSTGMVSAEESSDIHVVVNGRELTFDVYPYYYIEDRISVPLRPVFEALGASVHWDEPTKKIMVRAGKDLFIVFQAGSDKAVINEQEISIEIAVKIVDGRAMLPVSFIADNLAVNVSWDEDAKVVLIMEIDTFDWDGGYYAGEAIDGIPNGQGTWASPEGWYEGQFKDGLFDGRGTMVNFMGMEYSGEWKEGSAHGYGTLIVPDALIYVGEWYDGLYHSQGTLTFDHGEEYIGEFREGRPHGQGILTYSDGTFKEGLWVEGQLQEVSNEQ